MRSIAQFCYRRRRYVVSAWLAVFVGLTALSLVYGGDFNSEFTLPGSETQAATDLLEERGADERTGFQGQVVFEADQGVDDPEVREAIEGFLAAIERDVPGVEAISPYADGSEYQIAEGGKIAYAELNFANRDFSEYIEEAKVITDLRDEIAVAGLRIELGGDVFAEAPAFSSEFIGITAAVIILLIAFGSIIAMGLPIMTALFGIGTGVAVVTVLARWLPMPDFTKQMAGMIGIGVGIDYALLIVSRFRDGLREVSSRNNPCC